MEDHSEPEKDRPHDVLAAEMFAVPAVDPQLHALHGEPPHDVLAAEMYAVPAPDPILHRGPLALPDDLTGTVEPRDVLAAEEFPMPAPPAGPTHAHARALAREPSFDRPWLSVAVWALVILVAALSLRRRRRHAGQAWRTD
ncbi:MAG: hypothetical protein ACLP8S_31930 [Solirubrobacteraceae bacterium]